MQCFADLESRELCWSESRRSGMRRFLRRGAVLFFLYGCLAAREVFSIRTGLWRPRRLSTRHSPPGAGANANHPERQRLRRRDVDRSARPSTEPQSRPFARKARQSRRIPDIHRPSPDCSTTSIKRARGSARIRAGQCRTIPPPMCRRNGPRRCRCRAGSS